MLEHNISLYGNKNMRTITILFFLVSGMWTGCQEYSEYKKTPHQGIIITPHGVKIKNVKILGWKVGQNYKQEVSKGIKFHFILPSLKKEHLQNLTKMGIDSWAVKVTRKRIASSETLDYFTIPLVIPQKQFIGTDNFKPMKSGRVNIFYASSFISTDNSSGVCPKLGHRKIITELKIKREKSTTQHLHVSFINEASLKIKSRYIAYEPEKINAGSNLKGIYVIEFALYNKKKQKLMSNWFSLNEKIFIDMEKEIILKGCSFYDRTAPLGGN